MYCPRCGKRFSDKTSYCRTCGLSLVGVSEIVSGENANAPIKARRPNYTAFRLGFGLFILGTVLGLVNVVVRDLGLFPQIYGKIVFLAFIIAGLLCVGGAFLFPTTTYKKENRKTLATGSDSVDLFDTAELAYQLPPPDVSARDVHFPKDEREAVYPDPSSVTEHTTRHLK